MYEDVYICVYECVCVMIVCMCACVACVRVFEFCNLTVGPSRKLAVTLLQLGTSRGPALLLLFCHALPSWDLKPQESPAASSVLWLASMCPSTFVLAD